MSIWVSVSTKPKAEVPNWSDFQALQAQVTVMQSQIADLMKSPWGPDQKAANSS